MTLRASRLVTALPRPDARLRLVCFSYAGRGASVFARWGSEMPPSVEVSAAQYPGREDRLSDPPARRVGELVDALLPSIIERLDRPFAFFGHSLGSIIAFETMRALRERGLPLPLHLFVSARHAPQVATEPATATHRLPDAEFINAVQQRFVGVPRAILDEPELMRLLLPALRADCEMLETYAYRDGPPFAIPITAFGGLRDMAVTREGLEAWAGQTTSSFRLHMIDGDHFFVNDRQGPLVREIRSVVTALP